MAGKKKVETKAGKSYKPKVLGRSVRGPVAEVDRVPWTGGPIQVTLHCTEFSTCCPITGQPDYGELEIEYQPDGFLVETKSLKLFLQGFRDRAAFNESVVDELAGSLFEQIKPQWLRVTGLYNPRGGIAVECVAERGQKASVPHR